MFWIDLTAAVFMLLFAALGWQLAGTVGMLILGGGFWFVFLFNRPWLRQKYDS